MAEGVSAGVGSGADILRPAAFGGAHRGPRDTGRGGGSGGDGGGSLGIEMRDYVDAQDEKTRAQNDSRFAEVLAELKVARAAWGRSVWGAAIATIAAIAGLFIGIMAIEGDRFESGMIARDAITTVIQPVVDAQEKRDAAQADRDAAQDSRIDRILSALENSRGESQVGTSSGQD